MVLVMPPYLSPGSTSRTLLGTPGTMTPIWCPQKHKKERNSCIFRISQLNYAPTLCLALREGRERDLWYGFLELIFRQS